MGEIIVGIPHTVRTAILGPPPKPNREEWPYQGTINFQGILIYVENLPGSLREGRDANGKPWRVKMRHFYGEIPGTRGSDGDPVDVYVGDNPSAPMVYVLHQNHYFGTEHATPGTYDEDKVMLGFSTMDEAVRAYAAHFNHPVWMPGVTTLTVEELRARIADGGLELGAALVKGKPPGAGWEPIPGGRKGGWRKRKPGGGYRYAYDKPKPKPKKHKLLSDDERRKIMEASLERDPTRGLDAIKPGEIIAVGGRDGWYKWVPGAKREGRMTTSVQSVSTGAVELVRKDTLVALRKRKATKPPKRRVIPPPPPPPPPRRKVDAIPEEWGPRREQRPPATQVEGSAAGRKAAPWSQSTAPEGSALEAVENGSLILRQFKGRHDRRMRLTIHVPDRLKEQLATEMTGVFHQSARKVAKSFRPPISVVIPGTNSLSPDYKELVAGAQLGFVMALTNYRGGRAFIPVVQDYATVYALQAARGIRRGHALKERDLRALKGYIAARSRAATAKRAKSAEDPTRDEIIDQWYLTKRMVFTGRGESLGNYATKKGRETAIVDQAHEQVPLDDWRVKTPAGKEEGKPYPGKRKLAAKMEQLLNGEDVPDDSWLSEAPNNLLPNYDDLAMSAGTALHVRREVQEILQDMPDPRGTALAMRFGMHVPEDEDPDRMHALSGNQLKAMAKDRGLRASGNKTQLVTRILQWSANQNRPGTKGVEATAAQVADALNLTGKGGKPLPQASMNAKVRRLWKDGVQSFSRMATARDSAVAEYVRLWSSDLTDDPKADTKGEKQGPLLPSHAWLKGRFGTDERVYIYQAAIRAGHGQRTAKLLEREKANELSPRESAELRAEYHTQLRRDAQAAFARYQAVTVDPDKVHEIGPHTGTPGEAEWLYTEDVLARYMRARIRGGKENDG